MKGEGGILVTSNSGLEPYLFFFFFCCSARDLKAVTSLILLQIFHSPIMGIQKYVRGHFGRCLARWWKLDQTVETRPGAVEVVWVEGHSSIHGNKHIY
jgi:hypothetical protein